MLTITYPVSVFGDDADGLIYGQYWAQTSLDFSFPTSGAQYGSYSTGEQLTFQPLNVTMQTAVNSALAQYASVSNLSFNEKADAGSATIRFGMSDEAQDTAYTYMPSNSDQGGDVWFGTQTGTSAMTDPIKGNYAWISTLHEIGHALGLKHSFEPSPYNSSTMSIWHDSMEFTVMSYRSYFAASTSAGLTNEHFGFAQSPMMYDIAAIQKLYGANFTTHSGDTTYTFSPTTGEMFIDGVGQGKPGDNRIFLTIWDGGGNDTYDFSNYTTNLSIDLRPGSWSLISAAQRAYLGDGNFAHGNVYNALQYHGDSRSLIENAIGGSGNDTIIGNAANNTLKGGTGNDWLDGGAGFDTAVFDFSLAQATVDYGYRAMIVKGGGAVESLVSIEKLQFSDRAVVQSDSLVDDMFYTPTIVMFSTPALMRTSTMINLVGRKGVIRTVSLVRPNIWRNIMMLRLRESTPYSIMINSDGRKGEIPLTGSIRRNICGSTQMSPQQRLIRLSIICISVCMRGVLSRRMIC